MLVPEPRFCTVARGSGNRLPERVPILIPIADEVHRARRESTQRIAECRRGLPWLNAAKLDASIVDALVRLVDRRRRPQPDRTCHAAGGGIPAKHLVLAVELAGQRVRAVNV